MKLPFNLFRPKVKADYFLILFIKNSSLKALIFETIENSAKLVGKSLIKLENNFLNEDPEKLLELTDRLLAEAEKNLPENVRTQKTILSVSQSLVENGKIKPDVLLTLKKICKTLTLEPLGFLIYTEGLISFLQGVEGAPISAVIVEKDDKIIISLVRAGRIVESHEAVPLDYFPQAVDETLKNFVNIEVFPSRIIVASDQNLEQDFLKHTWSRDLPFIHTPQIKFLDEKFVEKSIIYTSLNQLNLTYSEADLNEEMQTPEMEIKNLSQNEKEMENQNNDNFGFVKDEDIKQVDQNIKYTQTESVITNDEDLVVEDKPNNLTREEKFETQIENSVDIEEEKTREDMHNNISVEGVATIDKVRSFTKSLLSKFKNIKLPNINLGFLKSRKIRGKNKHLIIIGAVIVLFVLIILSWVFLTFASVTIYFNPNYITNSASASFTTAGPSDFSNNTVAAQVITVNENGSVNEKATGSKSIGNPAKGQVTIFSRLTDDNTIKAGTILTSDNGLKFTLDNDTKISSFSGDPSDPSVTVSNVSITSSDIGDQYNLPSGSKFTISGYDSSNISAKNDNALSGGSKKNVTVVSKDDVDKAASDLINNLQNQAKSDTQSKVDGDFLIPNFVSEQVKNQKLSKNVGDQTDSFSMTATAQYQSLTASKSDLLAFAKNLLQNKVSSTLLQDNLINYDISNLKNNDGTITFKFDAKAKLIPVFDEKTIAKNISGKDLGHAQQTITAINQVKSVTINLFPSFPLLPKLIPFFPSHINFKTQEQ